MSERRRGGGWADFAAVVFAIVGIANGIQGLAALFKKEYFSESSLLYSNLRFWAIVWIVVGCLQLLAASMLVGRARGGRTLGIVLASVSALVAFVSIGAHSTWGLIVLAMDVLIIYGLTAHPEAFGEGAGSVGPGGLAGSQRSDMPPPRGF